MDNLTLVTVVLLTVVASILVLGIFGYLIYKLIEVKKALDAVAKMEAGITAAIGQLVVNSNQQTAVVTQMKSLLFSAPKEPETEDEYFEQLRGGLGMDEMTARDLAKRNFNQFGVSNDVEL